RSEPHRRDRGGGVHPARRRPASAGATHYRRLRGTPRQSAELRRKRTVLSGTLVIRNCQRAFAVDVRRFRELISGLLENILELDGFNLAIHLVDTRRMARINETFLQHEGSTDVITFDYADVVGETLHGE